MAHIPSSSVPQTRRTKGARDNNFLSGQHKKRLTGLSEQMICSGVKSEWERERITVSVNMGLNRASSVPQQEMKNLPWKFSFFAAAYSMPRNFVANCGRFALSRVAVYPGPLLMRNRIYGKGL